MSPLCSCGKFHEPCEADRRMTALCKAVREDPRVVAAWAAKECAWAAHWGSYGLPLNEREVLEKAWRTAIDAAQAVYSAVWKEKSQ